MAPRESTRTSVLPANIPSYLEDLPIFEEMPNPTVGRPAEVVEFALITLHPSADSPEEFSPEDIGAVLGRDIGCDDIYLASSTMRSSDGRYAISGVRPIIRDQIMAYMILSLGSEPRSSRRVERPAEKNILRYIPPEVRMFMDVGTRKTLVEGTLTDGVCERVREAYANSTAHGYAINPAVGIQFAEVHRFKDPNTYQDFLKSRAMFHMLE